MAVGAPRTAIHHRESPRAATTLATEAVAHAAPNGNTLLLVNPTIAINATLHESRSTLRDIEAIAGISRFPNVIVVNPDLPIRSVPDLIAYAKARPGELSMASLGSGTTIHLTGELFKLQTGIDMVHVLYRGTPAAIADLVAGRVHVMFDIIPTSIAQIKAGKLRGLAVTSPQRAAVLPDLPTVAEYLPGFEASVFFGLGAPRGTPPEIAEQLNTEVNLALSQPNAMSRFSGLGTTVLQGSRDDFGKLIADETGKWARVIRSAGIKAG
jgi:tripartite-type tricarboxylate transporter receptor subunit TctC